MKNYVAIAALLLAAAQWLPVDAKAQASPPPSPSASSATPQTPARRLLGEMAPKLADLTDTVLFGDMWALPQLSRRDRSLVTVSALVAMNRPDQLRSTSPWPGRMDLPNKN